MNRSATRCSLFSWSRSWLSRWPTRAPALSPSWSLAPPLAAALLLALGLLYAVALVRAETLLGRGLRSDSLSDQVSAVLRADAIFPLPARIREAKANLVAAAPDIPPTLALALLKSALAQSPHDPRLLTHKAVQHLRAGDIQSAEETHRRLRELAPHWPEIQRLGRLIEELRK